MSDAQRADHNVMKDIAPFTKLTPSERIKESEEIKLKMNKEEGLLSVGAAQKMRGFVLANPEV